MAEIVAKPSYESAGATSWIGYGWQVVPVPAGLRIRFAGGLRGTMSEVYYLPNGNSYAYITNYSGDGSDDEAGPISSQVFAALSPLPAGTGDLYTQAAYAEGTGTQPQVRAQKGVVHGASFEPGIVSGSWFSVVGWNLGTTTRIWGDADFVGKKLPTTLSGIQVFVNEKPAAVYYISPTQINAQAPDLGSFSGTATVRVVVDGVSSNPEPAEVRLQAPEFFRYSLGEKSFVAALHSSDATVVADPTLAPGLRAAKAGEILQIYGSGFTSSQAGEIVEGVTSTPGVGVKVGGQTANVQFAGLVAAGLFQVNVVVPALAAGDYPVIVTLGSATSLRAGSLSIR